MKSIIITAIFGAGSFFITNSASIETVTNQNVKASYQLVDVVSASSDELSEFPLGYIAYWADENGNIVKNASVEKQP